MRAAARAVAVAAVVHLLFVLVVNLAVLALGGRLALALGRGLDRLDGPKWLVVGGELGRLDLGDGEVRWYATFGAGEFIVIVRSRTVCTGAGGLGDVGLLTPGVGHARSVATNVSGYWLGLRKDDVPPTYGGVIGNGTVLAWHGTLEKLTLPHDANSVVQRNKKGNQTRGENSHTQGKGRNTIHAS